MMSDRLVEHCEEVSPADGSTCSACGANLAAGNDEKLEPVASAQEAAARFRGGALQCPIRVRVNAREGGFASRARGLAA
jgi:hypothetical protein